MKKTINVFVPKKSLLAHHVLPLIPPGWCIETIHAEEGSRSYRVVLTPCANHFKQLALFKEHSMTQAQAVTLYGLIEAATEVNWPYVKDRLEQFGITPEDVLVATEVLADAAHMPPLFEKSDF